MKMKILNGILVALTIIIFSNRGFSQTTGCLEILEMTVLPGLPVIAESSIEIQLKVKNNSTTSFNGLSGSIQFPTNLAFHFISIGGFGIYSGPGTQFCNFSIPIASTVPFGPGEIQTFLIKPIVSNVILP